MLHCWENPPETDYKPESALVSLIGLSSTFCRNCKQQPVQELEHGHIPRYPGPLAILCVTKLLDPMLEKL